MLKGTRWFLNNATKLRERWLAASSCQRLRIIRIAPGPADEFSLSVLSSNGWAQSQLYGQSAAPGMRQLLATRSVILFAADKSRSKTTLYRILRGAGLEREIRIESPDEWQTEDVNYPDTRLARISSDLSDWLASRAGQVVIYCGPETPFPHLCPHFETSCWDFARENQSRSGPDHNVYRGLFGPSHRFVPEFGNC